MTENHDVVVLAVEGDITRYPSEVIVNAANETLLGGGGVDGAIHRAAGPELLEACRSLHGAKTGESKMTDAFGITTAKKIVHTVGPIYGRHRGEEPALLAACYENSIALAVRHGLSTIAFAAISTGVYGYPREPATEIAVREVKAHQGKLERVIFCCFGADMAALYRDVTARSA